jgi:hypothetical protein
LRLLPNVRLTVIAFVLETFRATGQQVSIHVALTGVLSGLAGQKKKTIDIANKKFKNIKLR